MGYLICNKCGGYYELKEGESPEDFEECECGGSLDFVQNYNMHITDELDPLAEMNVCFNCGNENIKTSKVCVFCGKPLKNKQKDNSKNNILKNSGGFIHNALNFWRKQPLSRQIVLGILAICLIGFLVIRAFWVASPH